MHKLLLTFLIAFLGGNTLAQPPATDSLKDVPPGIYDAVEVEATFPAGDKAWTRFIINSVDGDVPARKKAPAGTYTVVIQFVVAKDGKLVLFKPLTNHGYGMEEEVIRALKTSPPWTPAYQNGRLVKAYRNQPVTFQVVEEKKKRRTRE